VPENINLKNRIEMKKITLLIICVLQMMATYAMQFTVGGVTYDDFNSTVIHEGLYRNVTVVGINSNFEGDLVIPALPAEFAGGLFYFRVTDIANNVFRNNAKITSVTLPNTLTRIGNSAFAGCTNLSTVILGAGITTIGDYAFEGCVNLSSITLGAKLTNFPANAFQGTSLVQINVDEGNTVYSSLNGVLYNKNRTSLICYPAGKTDQAFTVPNNVISIADNAFYGSKLKSVSLPESLKNIGVWSFGECANLSTITIPKNVDNIQVNSFNLCTGLTHFEVAAENTVFSSSDGVLYNKNKTAIFRYPPNKSNTSFTIPATVTAIFSYAFRDCLNLTSLFVSNNTATIGKGAFSWSKIKSITLSKKINFIDLYVFAGCSNLTDLTVYWNTPSEVSIAEAEWLWDDVFYEVDKSAVTLHVPPGTKAAYQISDVWKGFKIAEDAITGAATVMPPSSISLYPNPATDYILIKGIAAGTVTISDLSGRMVHRQTISSEDETIPVSSWMKGMYFITIQKGRETFKEKVLIR
jgi:hypothetical protein